jgi:hypothetical protein
LKRKINDLETDNKSKNIRDFYRGINEFKKGYQSRINNIKDENVNLLADPQSVLNRWKHFFNQVLNIHGVRNVTQKDMSHQCQNLVFLKWKLLLESYKSPGTDQIPAELIKGGGGVKRCVLRYKNLIVLYGIRINCHSSGKNLLLYQFVKRAIRHFNNYREISLLSTGYKI